jgi:hypothetical protein
MNERHASPKMTDDQAEKFWNNLPPKIKFQFSDMFNKMIRGELALKEVKVDDNEVIQNIVLEPKEKQSLPTAPYAKHFSNDTVERVEEKKEGDKLEWVSTDIS